jgi:hypothetical protein
MSERVDHPAHYGGESNPYEAKGAPLEDLQKAAWYLAREIEVWKGKP